MEIFLGAFTTQWEQRKAAFLHDRSLGRRPPTDGEERRRRGSSVIAPASSPGSMRARYGSDRDKVNASRTKQRPADRPMRARFAGLASGSQPVVVKLASFGGGGRLGAMINYVSRDGAVAVENERGDQLHGRDQLSKVGKEWDHILKNRAESRDIGSFKITVTGNDLDGGDLFSQARAIVRDGLGDRAFAIAVARRSDGLGFDIDGVTVLRNGQGERLTADAKASDLVQRRINDAQEDREISIGFRFTAHGNGTDYGTARLRSLVEKHKGDVFDDQGRQVADSKRAGDLVQQEWRVQLHSRKPRDVMHIVLSARAGTGVTAFHLAARDFLGKQFASHRYVYSLHDPSTDPKAEQAGGKRPHVHVHAIVAMRSDGGERIETTIRIFREWRLAMAESARKHGIDMEMTDRRDRASPAAYTRTQVRPVNTIGKTEHQGTSEPAQHRYDAKRRDELGFATTARGHAYERSARREWNNVAQSRASDAESAFAASQVSRLDDRRTNGESDVPRRSVDTNSRSQFRTHMVKLSEIISENDDMRHMTRSEFEAYEKRVEIALFQAERSMPASERKDFAEIADAAREHVNVRRELVEMIEQRMANDRTDPRVVNEERLDNRDRPQGPGEDVARNGVEVQEAASRALVENERAREAVQAAERSSDDPDRSQAAKREVDLALTKAAELEAPGNAIAREAAEIDDELRTALQTADRERHKAEKAQTTQSESPQPPTGEHRGTPRGVAEASPNEQRAASDNDGHPTDTDRPAGDTTRGDPPQQHIPRLEELQREADERHQRERDDRER